MLAFISKEATDLNPSTCDYTVSVVHNNDDQNEGDHCAKGSVQDNPAGNNDNYDNREADDNYLDEDKGFEGNADYDGEGAGHNNHHLRSIHNLSNASEAAKSTATTPTFSQFIDDVPKLH